MISIRANLLCWLLPGFASICLIAGMGIYFSTKYDLNAKLDAKLAELTDDLRPRPQPRGGNRPPLDQNEPFSHLPEEVYCELWFGQHAIKNRTAEKEDIQIPRPAEFTKEAVYYDALLGNGDTVRVRAEKISIMKGRGTHQPDILIAVSRKSVDATLSKLAGTLAAGGAACCLLFSGIVALALNISLRPLRQLGEKAALMNAESLHERFPEDSIPADIRPIVKRLNGLMANLEESFARERRFSGDIAHELRTPLAAIRSTSEVAIKWPDQVSPDDFNDIAKLSEQLQQTLDSLLLLARMESSSAEAIRESVAPARIVMECASLYTTTAKERGINLTLQLDEDLEIESDPRLLRIIVSNLINNAVEYAPAGSEVTLSVQPDGTLFRCSNSAPDLSKEDIHHLFERLWRKNAARTESGHTGLGLSIAKSCANVLGCSLKAELDEQNRLNIFLRPDAR